MMFIRRVSFDLHRGVFNDGTHRIVGECVEPRIRLFLVARCQTMQLVLHTYLPDWPLGLIAE